MRFQKLQWPLMAGNITKHDRQELIDFIKTDPILTNGPKVRQFEDEWSKWLGVKYSVFVNSGASANLLTLMAIKYENDVDKTTILAPLLTWVSDISSIIHAGFAPTFVDIDSKTLGMDKAQTEAQVYPHTKAIFVTNVLGLVADYPTDHNLLIEDCCESHGALYQGRKVGSIGRISNFSFYFAHHMTTIEGGMICTNEERLYETLRMLRSHGMTREMRNEHYKRQTEKENPSVHPSFLFAFPAFNCRSTELNAVLGLSQLKRLDENNSLRKKNFEVFLNEISPKFFRTDFKTEGMSPYGLILVLKEKNVILRDQIERLLTLCQVEFRRGLSGGGNQLRQPYLKHLGKKPQDYPETEHVTDFAWYIGNYPELSHSKIKNLCQLLNQF